MEPAAPLAASGQRHVMTTLAASLHVLFVALWFLALVRSLALEDGPRIFSLLVALCLGAVYASGVFLEKARTQPHTTFWILTVTVLWALLVVHVPDAAYLAFPLFFLYLHVLPPLPGTIAVFAVAAVAVVAIGARHGWTIGGVAGPTVAALAALVIGAGYRSLAHEAQRRQELIDELVATRAQLAARERTAGADAERTRLAGEIHDTIAQGLASIQMLLHATERAAPDHPQIDTIRLARETAGDNLKEARRVVQALRPGVLEGTSLTGALKKVADHCPTSADGTRPVVTVDTDLADEQNLPVPVASTLVRIAQESVTNAVRHGAAGRIEISVGEGPADTSGQPPPRIWMQVRDNGVGFDPAAPVAEGSFGLSTMRHRLAELGGQLSLSSAPGEGTCIRAVIPSKES